MKAAMVMRHCLIGLVLVCWACGSVDKPAPDKPILIRLWDFGGTPLNQDWLRQAVKEFNEAHSDIQVDFESRDWDTQRESLITTTIAGEGPDLVHVHHKYAVEFGELGGLYALDNFPDFPQVKELLLPNLLPHVQYQGKTYGIPITVLPFVMAVNRELLKKYGLEVPRTWEEMEAMGPVLKAAGLHTLTMPCSSHGDTAYRFISLFYKAGGRVLSDDLSKATFNGPAGLAALNFLLEMKEQGYMPEACTAYANDENIAHWCGGYALFSIEGPWWQETIQDNYHFDLAKMALAPIPVPAHPPEDNPSQTLLDVVMIAITGYSKSPAAAWKVLKALYLENPRWQVPDPALFGLPAFKAAYNPGVTSKFIDLEVLAAEGKKGLAWPGHPRITEIHSLIADAVNTALTGMKTPQQALDDAAREVDEILAE